MQKKISIVVPDYLQSQGINSVVDQFLINRSMFEQNGIEISGVYDGTGYYDHIPVRKQVTISGVKSNVKKSFLYKTYIFQKTNFFIRVLSKSKKAAQKTVSCNDSILVFQDAYAAFYYLKKRYTNTKCIYMTHMFDDELEQFLMNYPTIKGSKLEKKLRTMYAFVYQNSDAVITICQRAEEKIKKRYPEANIVTIYNAINEVECKKIINTTGVVNIVTASSLNIRKGSDVLLDVIKKSLADSQNNFVFHIFGSGDYFNIIKKWVADVQTNKVKLYGNVDKPYNNYSKMDCFIMVSRNETTPMSILEAMRSCLPVITTNVGAINEMITDGEEGIFVSMDSEEIVKKLKEITSDPQYLSLIGLNARNRFIENFTSKKWVEEFSKVFKRVMSDYGK